MTEKELQYLIRAQIATKPDIRLWRNNVGKMTDARGQVVTFGLCPGSSDLIGIQSVEITSDMVGQKIGVFVAVEVKSEKGRVSSGQSRYLEIIRKMGGIGILARKIEDITQLF